MCKASSALNHQLNGLIQCCGVTALTADKRRDFAHVIAEHGRDHARLTRTHPVSVAIDGVDLTVMCHIAEWVSKWPRWEGIRREALVDKGNRRFHPLIREVTKVRPHLMGQ